MLRPLPAARTAYTAAAAGLPPLQSIARPCYILKKLLRLRWTLRPALQQLNSTQSMCTTNAGVNTTVSRRWWQWQVVKEFWRKAASQEGRFFTGGS